MRVRATYMGEQLAPALHRVHVPGTDDKVCRLHEHALVLALVVTRVLAVVPAAAGVTHGTVRTVVHRVVVTACTGTRTRTSTSTGTGTGPSTGTRTRAPVALCLPRQRGCP